jgi:hypothetical protein
MECTSHHQKKFAFLTLLLSVLGLFSASAASVHGALDFDAFAHKHRMKPMRVAGALPEDAMHHIWQDWKRAWDLVDKESGGIVHCV